jgi:hypothetical protein
VVPGTISAQSRSIQKQTGMAFTTAEYSAFKSLLFRGRRCTDPSVLMASARYPSYAQFADGRCAHSVLAPMSVPVGGDQLIV